MKTLWMCILLILALNLITLPATANEVNYGILAPGTAQYPNGSMMKVDSMSFDGGLSSDNFAAFDDTTGYGYFLTRSTSSMTVMRLIKVALPAGGHPRQVATLTFDPYISSNRPFSLAVDRIHHYAYIGIGDDMGGNRILKVALGNGDTTPRLVATMASWDGTPTPALLDPARGVGYFGNNLGSVVKVALGDGDATPTQIGKLPLPDTEFSLFMLINPATGYGYLIHDHTGLMKFRLGAAAEAPTRVGYQDILASGDLGGCAFLDPTRNLAYFASNSALTRIALGTGDDLPTLSGTLSLGVTNPNQFKQPLFDPTRNEAWLFHSDLYVRKYRLGTGGQPIIADGVLDLQAAGMGGQAFLDAANGLAYFDYGPLAKVSLTQKCAIQASRITLAQGCQAQHVNFYSLNAAGNLRLALYNGDTSRTLLWQSNSVANTAQQGWLSIPVSSGTPNSLTLPAGDYWLAWQTDSTSDIGACTTGTLTDGFSYFQAYGAFPATLSVNDAAFHHLPALWTASVSGASTPTPPAIKTQSLNQQVMMGATAQFQCQAIGSLPLDYRWFKDNVALSEDSRIRGVTSNTLTILSAQTGDLGLYHCQVTNGLETASTRQVILNVVPLAPAITGQPLARSVAPGQPATFSVTASGTPPLYYQWKRDGVALLDVGAVSGSQSATLALDFASRPMAGTYTCEVTNSVGKAVSSGALLTVAPGTTLSTIEPLTPHPGNNSDYGHAIVDLGDVNGDGYADLAVSANEYTGEFTPSGHVYILNGKTGAMLYDLTSSQVLGNNLGEDFFGFVLAPLPDITGDGVRELAVGDRVGTIYAVNVKTAQKLWSLSPGAACSSLAAVPDVNQDGKDDLVVDMPIYQTNGSVLGRTCVYNGVTGAKLLTIENQGSQRDFDQCVAGVPDTNGDGRGDILVYSEDKVFLYSGADGKLLRSPALPALKENPQLLPASVIGLADVDGDGHGDFAVAANWADYPGRILLFSGASGALLNTILPDKPLGSSSSSNPLVQVPDLDGDGVDDIAYGVPEESPDNAPERCGAVYLFSSKTGAKLQKILSPDKIYLGGFGRCLAGLRDPGGSGHIGVAVGANFENAPGTPSHSGRVRVFRGPDLQASPGELDFGLQAFAAGVNATTTLTLTNASLGLLRIAPLTLAGPDAASFRLTAPATTTTLVIGKSMVISVQFQPAASGARQAEIRVVSNDANNPVVSIPLIARTTSDKKPRILSSPPSYRINEGTTVALTVVATSYPPSTLSYRWYQNGQALEDGSRLHGVRTGTLTVGPASPGEAGNYTCQVSNGVGQASTTPVAIQVVSPVAITVEPAPGVIQAAIDAATDHSTITLALGTYHERINMHGRNLTLRSSDPTSAAAVAGTSLDGDQLGNVVTFKGAEDSTCLIDGLTITNGRGVKGAGVQGNGTHATLRRNRVMANVNSDPAYNLNNIVGGGLWDCDGLIDHNLIADNHGDYGAGLALCDGLITSNTIASNRGTYGGGLYQCNGLIQGNLITGNYASSFGGGLDVCKGPIMDNTITSNSTDLSAGEHRGGGLAQCGDVIHNLIANNRAYSGGGIFSGINTGVIRRNRILNNRAVEGGGLCNPFAVSDCIIAGNHADTVGGGAIKTLTPFANNTIINNTAGQRSGGVEETAPGYSHTIDNCIVYGNTAPVSPQTNEPTDSIRYCCIQDYTGIATGTFAADPLFINAAAQDFHLRANSPCVDAGHATNLSWQTVDFDGDPRIIATLNSVHGDGTHIDIGADEYDALLGSLLVNVTPSAAISAGAKWRRVGTTVWQDVGITENGIPAGPYFVEFKDVNAFLTPGRLPVQVVSHQTAQVSAAYSGYLKLISASTAVVAVVPGKPVSLQVLYSGTPVITYQWYKNGVAIPGATAPTYAIASCQGGDDAVYVCRVSNGYVTAESNGIRLIVNNGGPVIAYLLGLTSSASGLDLNKDGRVDIGDALRGVWSTPPDTPSSPLPANGATGMGLKLRLNWADCGRALSYDVYLWEKGTSRPAKPTASGLTASQCDVISGLDSQKIYQWQVIALGAQSQAAGPVWTFSTN